MFCLALRSGTYTAHACGFFSRNNHKWKDSLLQAVWKTVARNRNVLDVQAMCMVAMRRVQDRRFAALPCRHVWVRGWRPRGSIDECVAQRPAAWLCQSLGAAHLRDFGCGCRCWWPHACDCLLSLTWRTSSIRLSRSEVEFLQPTSGMTYTTSPGTTTKKELR